MDNYCKRNENWRTHLVRLTLVLMVAVSLPLTPLTAAHAATPPAQNPGCETYGCLYEHCPSHYGRDGQTGDCRYGVAYERLPDGPDNRRFVEVLWPGHYDPDRRAMWDQVAYCESTWRWSYDGPSGFDGGVQFSTSTWRAFGGSEYAPYAYQATPEQQIDIAERVAFHGHGNNRAQGRGAWPHCGHYLSAP